MGKFTLKLIAILLCLAMIGTALPAPAHAEGTDAEYTLYPTPHSVSYGEGSFELTDINVLYGEGVDDYTKARLEETATLRGLAVTEVEADANVCVAIYGSGDAAESHILANYTVDAALFDETDANFVAAKDGEIVVLGKDTDSCFYGLTTLYQIFGQLTDNTLRNLTINDYADVASRGFIEGYYGNPWSTEDRAALMTWGGYYKLNSYFYAPKDDPKHNSAWRELYTDEELETLIRPLADAGNASKCRFVFALHPYMYNPIRHSSETTYQEDLAVLQAKFEQVISAGVRQIAILADDASNVGGSNYTRLLNDMTNWIVEMQEDYPDLKLLLPFVTQEYMGYGQYYYRDFPENVQIVMTGGQVWGFVSPYFTNSFYSNVGRGAYMWINWPCTDNSKNHLIMGGYADFLQPGVDPNKVEGIVLNPMQQSEPSKVAIFGNACYTWNMWETEEEADAAWDASFACVDHNSVVPSDASDALRELSKHMIDQTRFEDNPNVLEESVVLRHELSAFQTKLSAGTYTQEDIDSLVEEFTILQNAAAVYRQEGSERIVSQIEPWLGNWDDQTLSILSYLNALSAILNDSGDDVIWGSYAAGQAAYESSKNHPLWYMDHYEYAESGYRFIVPFMKALDAYLAEYVKDIVDPSGGLSGGGSGGSTGTGGPVTGLTAFEGNNPGYYSGNLNSVVDGSTGTSLWYNDYARVGQYIGVDLGRPVLIGNVTFTQDAGDHFSDYTLQYSTDGVTYYNYKNYSEAVLEADLSGSGIEARYLRFYNNAVTNVWIKVYEIAVTEAAATKVMTNSAAAADWQTRIGNDTAELLTSGTLTLAPGEYIGFDLRRIKDLASIEVAEQGALTLQVSKNDVDWATVEAGEVTEDGRYVRLINLTDADVTVNLTTFTVTCHVYSGPYLLESDIGINSSWGVAEDSRDNGAAFDGNIGTTTEFGDFVAEGQYIIYDLGTERDIWKLEIYCADSALNYIRDAEMQISNDLQNWTTVLTIGDGVENTGEANVTCINSDAGYSQATSAYPNIVSIEGEIETTTARYLRIIMTAPNNERAVLFNEIEINEGEYVSVSNDPTFEISHIEVQGYPPQNMIDGDLTTSWRPDADEAGYMIYTFSDNLTANRINVVQKTVSNARVYVYAENDGQRNWIDMGTLNKSLVTLACQNDLNLALKIEWDAETVPNITEIVRFTVEVECEHSFGEYVSDNNATCTTDGTKTAVCELCGETHTVVDEGTALGHDMGEWETVTGPTCTAEGTEQRTCSRCDHAEIRALAAVGHTEEILPAVAATCTENGLTEGKKCAVCGEILVPQEVIEALGHSYESVVTEPSCTEDGYTTHTCTVCGHSYADSYVEARGHVYVDLVSAPTCTRGGYTTHNCAFCDDSFVDSYVAPLGHDWHGTGCTRCSAKRVNPFTDVPEDSFFIDPVLWAVEEGITTGATETTFDPNGVSLRGHVVTFLWRAAGCPEPASTVTPFTDVAETDFYYKAVLWAVEKGITNGTSETTFSPAAPCSRAQVVTFLWRAADKPAPASSENPFSDVVVTDYYGKAVLWAVENGITNGMGDGTFGVNATCNRAQAVTFLYRLYK